MVHRVIVCRHEEPSSGDDQAACSCRGTTTTNKLLSKKRRGRRGDAIVAIKERLLRCSSEQGRRRFKRGYLLAGDGRGDAADSAIFYLACLVCTASRRRAALLTS